MKPLPFPVNRTVAQKMISLVSKMPNRSKTWQSWCSQIARAIGIVLCISSTATAQTISFTFDDGFDPRKQSEATAWNTRILTTLKSNSVEAMIFPAGKIVDSTEGRALVHQWSIAGEAIGNHTYSHGNFASPDMSLAAFTDDVLGLERLFSSEKGWQKRLRFPYLKEGETEEKVNGMRQWMLHHDYLPAPVSIDASDWYYNARFLARKAKTPGADDAPICDLYVKHLLDRANYYDSLAFTLLKRHPSHVMLLHTNAINAAFLPEIIKAFRDSGWKIISPMEAFKDPLYLHEPKFLPAGESIVWALANDADISGLRYPGEDDAYEKPVLDAAGL